MDLGVQWSPRLEWSLGTEHMARRVLPLAWERDCAPEPLTQRAETISTQGTKVALNR